jgi:hypothetical protein
MKEICCYCNGYQEPREMGVYPCECEGTLYYRVKELEEKLARVEMVVEKLLEEREQ